MWHVINNDVCNNRHSKAISSCYSNFQSKITHLFFVCKYRFHSQALKPTEDYCIVSNSQRLVVLAINIFGIRQCAGENSSTSYKRTAEIINCKLHK